MTKPKIKYNTDQKLQTLHYLGIASYIKRNFYQKKNFYVLPKPTEHKQGIYFPKPNEKITNLVWKNCEYQDLSKKELNRTTSFIKENFNLPKPNPLKKTELNKLFPKFWTELNKFIPKFTKDIKEITICPTAIGSFGSERSSWLKNKSKIIIYIRDTEPVETIFYLILMERCNRFYSTRDYKDVKSQRWEIINTIPRFLTSETSLSKYIKTKDFFRVEKFPTQDTNLKKESDKYIKSLGFNNPVKIKISSNSIKINNQKIKLAPNEKKLFKLLYRKANKLIKYDEISETLWKEPDEDFSLYAISKSISRIRREIRNAGIMTEIIHTKKGKGYTLIINT